jgi:hypothetical protein
MFTRMMECTIDLARKEEFNNAIANELLPVLSRQPGFVDVTALTSDDRASHAYVLTFWKSKGDADQFYPHTSPETELLKRFFQDSPAVESLYVTTSALHRIAAGKAA